MLLKALTVALFVAVASEYVAGHNIPDVPNFIPAKPTEPTWKAPREYLDMPFKQIEHRDHGCVELEDGPEGQSFQCFNIWLKNKFSANEVKPTTVFLDYVHHEHKREDAYKPTVTWVENINPWRVRGCVAQPGGKKNTLAGGKVKWLAVYDISANSATEKQGVIAFNRMTSAKSCLTVSFGTPFAANPTVKFQLKLRNGLMSARDALVIWGKDISTASATVCAEEFYGWSRYHDAFDVYYYAVSAPVQQDKFSTHNMIKFNAGDQFPADHRELNHFYCKNVTLNQWHYPCAAALVQAVEPSRAVCDSAVVAWVAYLKNDLMTVCYADKRGIMGVRKTDVEVHYTVYGAADLCQSHQCPATQECIHPTMDTVACGCYKECSEIDEPACGTNMKTYKNRCYLEKEACESGNKFSYAHHGKCEESTVGHGRAQLSSVQGCDGLYCAVIPTGNQIWYKDAPINVQISVNWMNNIGGDRPSTHDATASWVEDVTPNSFKACVMEAGRQNLLNGPYINWFAYQGHVDKVMSQKIEVGEWRSGTHCVPLHERTIMEKPFPEHPKECPEIDINAVPKTSDANEERWHYDSHVMSKLHGQQQHEWFKRMKDGYGVKKLKLKSGMHLNGATVMLTVEQNNNGDGLKDAVNAWMEYDGATQEAYVCLREMQNWDGKHEGINVHWTLFMDKNISRDDVWMKSESASPTAAPTMKPTESSMGMMKDMMMASNDQGFVKTLKFKPALKAPEENDYAFCQLQKFVPDNFSEDHKSTVLVSLSHHIPEHAALESMKKYKLHQMEISKGMPMGDMSFNDEHSQASWMMPYMWRSNLTGWRPHMRIGKDTDYSAWVEGMNNTHIRVCQKSIFSGYHYEGVTVNLVVLPDRCPSGYTPFHGSCARLSPNCGNYNQARQGCAATSDKLGAPNSAAENVFYSYLANQQTIHSGKSDAATEGTWLREDGQAVSYTRWAEGEPKSTPADLDCSIQKGLSENFLEYADKCSACHLYVCHRAAPQLNF